ncbi:MAG: DUF1573 domain-containing protein [Saprospiraceae bacterium]
MRRIFWPIIVAFCPTVLLLAQPTGKSSYETRVAVAGEKMAEKDFYNAVILYEEAFEEREDEKLLPLIASLHLKLRDYVKAQRAYGRFLRRDKNNKSIALRFDYGRALKMTGNYDEAIAEFQKFLESSPGDSLRELVQNELSGAELGKKWANQAPKLAIEAAEGKVNSPFSEYSPAFSRSGQLYYGGFNKSEVIIVEEDNQDEVYAKIFTSRKDEKGIWGKPDSLDQKINRPGFHSGNVAFSPDGNRMYFTRATLQGNELADSKIFLSVGGDGAWGAAEELLGVNGDYIAKNPVVGELFGREVLFFSANIEGGYGGFDLYYATLKSEGVYADPVSLGPKINTPGDEVTPFFFNGTLYFSSNGHPGIGGQDIFYAVWNGSLWSEPRNMGIGFNTPQDDQYFTLDKDGYNGALTSNRPGGKSVYARTCCDDIFTFTIEKIKADLVVGIFDASGKQLNGGSIALSTIDALGEGSPKIIANANGNRFDFPLELDKAYIIRASHPDYFPDSAKIVTLGLEASKVFEQRFSLKKLPPPPAPEPEYDTITLQEAIVLENILYDFDDDKIKAEAESDLNVVLEIMNQYPDMVIELSSHTDYRGNDLYNERLSQRRADSAKRWLEQKGIAVGRIIAKGYGEGQPRKLTPRQAALDSLFKADDVLTPAFIDALADETVRELAHGINRRTEFKIVKGPTSITIMRTSLRRQGGEKPGPEAKPATAPATPPKPAVNISSLSSLRGRQDLKGVPIMNFRERVFDFGKVTKGETREHTFEFANIGDTPLKIGVVSSCDCTTTEYSTLPVPPGGKGKIRVVFDSAKKDADEIIDVDVILDNTEPDTGRPIIERLRYRYTLQK